MQNHEICFMDILINSHHHFVLVSFVLTFCYQSLKVQLYGPRTTMNNLQNESPTDGISNAAEIKKRSRDDEFSTISMSQFSVLR